MCSNPSLLLYLQGNFVCRSAEYNYVTLQCRLSDIDRRTMRDGFLVAELSAAPGVDYFENLCLQGQFNYTVVV